MSFTEVAARRAKAEQGKSAEKSVATYLNDLSNAYAPFDYQRGYDARAAGGKFQRVAGDFQFFSPNIHGVIEVKETKFPERLPYGNFETSAVAKCVKRRLAGGLAIVLIYHETTELWRMLPISFFQRRDLDKGSWFLDGWKTYTNVTEMLDLTVRSGVLAMAVDRQTILHTVEGVLT